MRKTKIVALVLALLMVSALLVACGKFDAPDQVFAEYEDKSPTYTTATQLNVSGHIANSEGWTAIMEDETADGKEVSRLVDLAEGKVLLEFTNTDKVTYELEMGEVGESVAVLLITVDSTDSAKVKTTITLYDKNGTQIAQSDKLDEDDVDSFADLLVFGESVYRVAEDGSITLAFEHKSYESELPEIDAYTSDYYLNIEDDVVYAYDNNLDLISVYKAPSYAQSVVAFALNNGNVFVQYRVELPYDAEDYDLYYGAKKWDIVTVIVDPDDGDADDIDFEYLVDEGGSRISQKSYFESLGYVDSIENIVVAYEIDDNYRVDKSELTVKILVVSNNGQVKGSLLEMIPNQVAYDEAAAVRYGEDLFLVINASGERVLIDAAGDVIANIGRNSVSKYNELYIVIGDVIYDHDMNKLFDLEEKEMSIEHVLDRSIILEDEDGKFYLFNGTAEPTVIDGDDNTTYTYLYNSRVFAVKKVADGKTTYTYYNDLGVAVLSDSELRLGHNRTIEGGAATILSGADANNKTVYYIFK